MSATTNAVIKCFKQPSFPPPAYNGRLLLCRAVGGLRTHRLGLRISHKWEIHDKKILHFSSGSVMPSAAQSLATSSVSNFFLPLIFAFKEFALIFTIGARLSWLKPAAIIFPLSKFALTTVLHLLIHCISHFWEHPYHTPQSGLCQPTNGNLFF